MLVGLNDPSVRLHGFFFCLHGIFLRDGKVVSVHGRRFCMNKGFFCMNEDLFLHMEGMFCRAEGFFLYLAHGRRFSHDIRRFFSTSKTCVRTKAFFFTCKALFE